MSLTGLKPSRSTKKTARRPFFDSHFLAAAASRSSKYRRVGRPVRASTDAPRTGRWTDINKNSFYADQTAQLTRNYLSAFIEHGVNPTNASYAYVILPTATPDQTAQYAQTPNIQVVANTATVQAARCLSSGVLGINFWAAGTASIVTSQDPGSHPSEEFVIVTRGRLVVEVANERYELDEGDSVKIDRNLPHRFINGGDEAAEVLIVLSPAIF